MANDPAITELDASLKALNATLTKTNENANKAKAGVSGLADESKKTSDATAALNTAFGNLASSGMQKAIDATVEWIRDVPEAASRAQEHARILQRLGSAYGEVQRATAGAVTAEQANRVQQSLAQAGLTLTGRELAAVTARAREYARATGVETTQAIEQLSEALRNGEAGGLRRFGVAVQAGANRADAMSSALRQLQTQADTMGTSAQSLAEASDELSRTWGELNDSLRGSIAEEAGLRDFFTNLTSWLRATAHEGDTLAGVFRAVIGTAREMAGLRSDAGPAQNQSASGAVVGQYGQLLASARAVGIDTRRFPLPGAIAQATPAEQAQLFGSMGREINARRSAPGAASAFGGPVDLSSIPTIGDVGDGTATSAADIANRIAGNTTARASIATDVARKQAQAAAAQRRAELGAIRSANTSAGGAASAPVDNTAAEFAAARSGAPVSAEWAAAFVAGLQRIAQVQTQALGGTLDERSAGIERRRAGAEASLGVGRDGGDRSGNERIRILREQREALVALSVEAEHQEDLAVRAQAPESEINDLMRSRIGIQQALARSTQELTAAQAAQGDGLGDFKTKMETTLSSTVDGFAAATAAAIDSGEAWDEAMGKMLRASLKALVQQSIVEALKNTALGIGAVAMGNPAAAGFFAAAGAWTAVGVAAGVGLAVSRPSAPAAGAGGASAGAARADMGAARADRSQGNSGPLVLNIAVSGALFNDGVYEGVGRAVREATSRGYLQPGTGN